MLFSVEIDRTGYICVEANSCAEAREQVKNMTTKEIEERGDITGYDVGEAEPISED